MKYVNVYEVTQEYGGPEEGGWWYSCRHPLGSVPIQKEETAKKLIGILKEEFEHIKKGKYVGEILGGNPDDLDSTEDFDPNDMSGVETGTDLLILVEDEPGERTPKPYYE
jgi:hypothetical protein